MIVGVPKEVSPEESRVSLVPSSLAKLKKLGFEVVVESGAGLKANFTDAQYEAAGARLVAGARDLWSQADIVVKVRPPAENLQLSEHEAELCRSGQTLVSFIWPGQNQGLIERLNTKKINIVAMDRIPRISRAQKMDALSSMANIAGYRAVIEAAINFGRFFTGQITAAGKVEPAKVLVIGAGVAGLSAIGTAKSLGAIVRAFDTRPAVKDQITSMGAQFLELDFEEDGTGEGGYAKVMSKEFIEAEMKLFAAQAEEVDIIITTALIPGKPAPELITEAMVETMKEGSVIVDLAAEQGGNCSLTEPGQVVVKHGVTIVGFSDLPSRMPQVASRLYSANICHLLDDMSRGESGFQIDLSDSVVWDACVAKGGELRWPTPEPPPEIKAKNVTDASVAKAPPSAKDIDGQREAMEARKASMRKLWTLVGASLGAVLLILLATWAPASFLGHFTVFILSCFVGWQVIWNVAPSLHTPLMSVTNAISGIIVIGAILQLSQTSSTAVTILASVAILIATINISGGFLVTQRMLKMFRK